MKGQAVVIDPWADFEEEESRPEETTPPLQQIEAAARQRGLSEAERVAIAEQRERDRLAEIEQRKAEAERAAQQKAEQEAIEARNLVLQRVEPKTVTPPWPQRATPEPVVTAARGSGPLVSSIFDVEPVTEPVEPTAPTPILKVVNYAAQKSAFKLGPAFESADEPTA